MKAVTVWCSALAILCVTAMVAAAPGEGSVLSPLVGPYIRVQALLAADSIDGVPVLAESIAGGAMALGEPGDAIRAAAIELGRAADIKAARLAFGKVGNAILTHVLAVGATLEPDVRVAYCPMARKYWLQRGEAIRNPFYGATMLDCGRLVDKVPNLEKK
jgi:hypothetical protein